MEFKICPEIIIDSTGGKGTPRCPNFDSKKDTCDGRLRFKCCPYNKEELKKLEVYWKCIMEAERNGINN